MNKKKFYSKMENILLLLAIVSLLSVLILRLKNKKESNQVVTLDVKNLILNLTQQLEEVSKINLKMNRFPPYIIKNADIEANFVVKEGVNSKGGITYEIVTAESENIYESNKVQKISLHLVPNEPDTSAPAENENVIK